MSKKIKITLSPTGEIQMETIGIKGKKCLDYIEILKKLMNVKIDDTKLTHEYYETDGTVSDAENVEIRNDF